MKRYFTINYWLLLIKTLLLTGVGLSATAQTFTFTPREYSKKKHAVAMNTGSLPVIDTAYNNDDWGNLTNGTWMNNNAFKSVRSFVRFYVDHSYRNKIATPYMYKLCYELKGYANASSSATVIYDTLVISYNPDSLTSYQDRQEKAYSGFQRIIVKVTSFFDITNPLSPVSITLNDPNFDNLNFILETAVTVQKYEKSSTQYGPGVTPTTTASVSNGKLNIVIKGPGGVTPPVPCNYELEWLYIDSYKDSASSYSASQLQYDFRNNSTRVWLTEPTYAIPLVYQDGFVVYRVRYVRPDINSYRYPIYSKWSTPEKGTVSSASYYDVAPHKSDNLNWQYTVSFAEQGKFKQVLSYYDGLLKNRQTITRFNSLPNKVVVMENTYDYEGRPSIKTLPVPVTTSTFEYLNDVSLNNSTSLPYQASDFDNNITYTCPTELMPAKLSNTALANIYYSKSNPDTADYQKYVPDAKGYPFTQTIYSPGYNDRIEKQGGAGDSLQIGTQHYTTYDYVGGDQADLNRLMGSDVGWSGFYNKTVTKDPNGQTSMTVKDFKGKLVHTSMIGNVNYLTHAFDADTMGGPASYFEQDLIGGNPQQIIGDQRILDHNFFMDAGGVAKLQYIYSFKPYKTFCPTKYLSIASAYEYELFDECGDVKHSEAGTLGVNGVVDSTTRNYPGVKHSVSLNKGKHSVHKELTVDMNNIYAAVDSFMLLPNNCLKTVHNFIKEEVLERTFPCPSEEMEDDPCTQKRKQMLEDLKPGGKYGGYRYLDDIYHVARLTGTGWYSVNGSSGNRDNNKSVFDRDEDYNYRYQDNCIGYVGTVTKNGVAYNWADVINMPAEDFLYFYSGDVADQIAQILLPLHPEYCRLQSCFTDSFKERYLAIPDAKTAEALGLLYVADIIDKDPFADSMAVMGFASPADSLNSFKGGKIFFDTLITTIAYCNSTDSMMYQTCKNDVFKTEIQTLTLANDYVKEVYFKHMKQLYFQNRERFKHYRIATITDNCGPCFSGDERIKLIPPAHFTTYFTATGGLDTSSETSFWSSFLNDTSSTGSTLDDIDDFINMGVEMSEDSINMYNDTANQIYTRTDSLLAVEQADSITARLVNCYGANTSAMNGIKNYLKNLYSLGQVHFGNYTPSQIRDAILSQGLTLDDLCNPYLVNYSDFILNPTDNLLCKQESYYYSLKLFLDRTIATGTLSSYSAATVNLTSDEFDMELSSRFAGVATVNVKGQYDSYGDLYTLKIYTNTADTVKLFLRGHASPGAAVCGAVFNNPGSDIITVDDVKCIREAGSVGEGYIGHYAFTVRISRTTPAPASVTTTCTLLGWNNDVELANVTEDKLASCVPCTQMKALYEELQDTLSAYQIYGVDHPYYSQVLRSFMNYRLRKRFTTDQYERFIESCQLADSLFIKKYSGYATFVFTSDNAITTFMNHMNSITPGVTVDDFYKEQWGPSGFTVMVNLNNVPKEKLHIYKYELANHSGPTQRYINDPFDNIIPGRIGFMFVPVSASFTPVWAQILDTMTDITYGAYYDTTTITSSSVLFKQGGVYVPHTAYLFPHNNSAPAIRSLFTYKVNKHIVDRGLPATFIEHYASTVDEDYDKPEKVSLLRYVYSLQHLDPSIVLDSMQEYSLNNRVYAPLSTSATYNNPARPGNRTNLYVADLSTNYFKKVDTMLNKIATLNGGRITMTTATNTIQGVGVNAGFTAYRCSDGSYWIRYFAAADTLFNVFFTLPKYVVGSRHYDFMPLFNTLAPAPGDSLSRNFVIRLRDNNTNALGAHDTLTIQGRTDFVVSKNLTLEDVVLGNPIDGKVTVPDTFDHCERTRLSTAIYEGKWRHAQYIDSIRNFLANDFYAHVMNGVFEALNLEYLDQRFQRTLYFYDRAENLIKTVPPRGVAAIANNLVKKVDTVRKANTQTLLPSHQKATVYNYDSRNQLIRQTTPDAGTTLFWYDAAGRLVFSQNAKQYVKGKYTYNLYDNQSRVVETGQVALGCPGFDELNVPNSYTYNGCHYVRTSPTPNFKIVSPHPPLVTGLSGYTNDQVTAGIRIKHREDVVLTIYDTTAKNLTAVSGLSAQENLRKRVSAIRYFTNLSPLDTTFLQYSYTSYYSYDATGNVKTLTHDFPVLESYLQRYKRVDYDYDIISGKVNLLSYNRSFADQYYQRYSYDDDNRITKVETSADGLIWKRDAEYDYYQHGPLARMSLGDLRVQGVDYAYTIQGWLKAINSDILTPEADMGKDAIDDTSVYANDAFALTLDYFKGDYSPIGPDSFMHLAHNGKNLYNGNIARQTVGILPFDPLKTDYTYDQLHRIKGARYDLIDPVNKTLTAIDDYRSNYQYDLDGNITRLVRIGNNPTTNTIAGAAQLMDSMNYYYANSIRPNRLTNVTDRATTTAFNNDIQPFTTVGATRFLYDEIGNMTKDLVNNQDNIGWNLYNKVTKTTNATAKNSLDFMYEGGGNRVAKLFMQQKDSSFVQDGDYYVRDAQGNILAVYKTENKYTVEVIKAIEDIRGEIVAGPGTGVYFDTIIRNWRDATFDASFLTKAGTNQPTWVEDKVESYDVSFYLQGGKQQDVLEGTSLYLSPFAAYNKDNELTVIENAWSEMFSKQDVDYVYNWTNALFNVGSASTKRDLLSMLCAADQGLEAVNALRIALGLTEAGECGEAINDLVDNINSGNIETLRDGFVSAYQTYPDAFQQMFHGISYSADIISSPDYMASGAPFAAMLKLSLSGYIDGAGQEQLYAFFDEWEYARAQLNTVSTTAELNSIAYHSNPTAYIIDYGTVHGYEVTDTLLVSSPGFYLGSLLKIIKDAVDFGVQQQVEIALITRQVNEGRRIWLAEHHLYGSSRLGIRHYWKDQLYNFWDYSQSQVSPALDTATLQTRMPWYSGEYSDVIKAASLTPYSNAQSLPFSVQHTLGLKGYELNNHLGNVQAVVIDKRQDIDLNSDNLVDRYRPSLMAAYDYYPFGSLMPGRYVSDTTTQCAWISQTRMLPQWTYVPIWPEWNTHDFATIGDAHIDFSDQGTPEAQLMLFSNELYSGMQTVMSITPGTVEDILIPVANVDGVFALLVEAAEVDEEEAWETVTAREIESPDEIRILFENVDNTLLRFTVVRVSEGGGQALLRLLPWKRWKLIYTPQTSLVKVCNGGEDKYRFGFNGKEKDNEMKGLGNSLDYGFRMLDSRLGRFLSVDPLTDQYPMLTPYQFGSNNPIWNIDLDGLEGVRVASNPMWYIGEGIGQMWSTGAAWVDNVFAFGAERKISTPLSINKKGGSTVTTSTFVSTKTTYSTNLVNWVNTAKHRGASSTNTMPSVAKKISEFTYGTEVKTKTANKTATVTVSNKETKVEISTEKNVKFGNIALPVKTSFSNSSNRKASGSVQVSTPTSDGASANVKATGTVNGNDGQVSGSVSVGGQVVDEKNNTVSGSVFIQVATPTTSNQSGNSQ